MLEKFTQVDAEQEVTIYPDIKNTRKSMKIWRKGNTLRLETYNGWGTLDTTIHMTTEDLCGALRILHQCNS